MGITLSLYQRSSKRLTRLARAGPSRTRPSPMTLYTPRVSDFLASTLTALVVASLLAFLVSIVIAVSLSSDNSEIPVYPVKSTWLQRKRQFRVNGARIIEQGFVEVTLSITTSWKLTGTNLFRPPTVSFGSCILMVRSKQS
jgi:hypothetical protein